MAKYRLLRDMGHFLGETFPEGTIVNGRPYPADPRYVEITLPDGIMLTVDEGYEVEKVTEASKQAGHGGGGVRCDNCGAWVYQLEPGIWRHVDNASGNCSNPEPDPHDWPFEASKRANAEEWENPSGWADGEEASGYDIFHAECGQWHSIPGTGVVTCPVNGDKFEMGSGQVSDAWPGELKDSDGFDRGERISARKTADTNYCPNCGAVETEADTCPQCGTAMKEASKMGYRDQPRTWAVSLQAPWNPDEWENHPGRHVEIAVGGIDAVSPGALGSPRIEEFYDPREAAEAAIELAQAENTGIEYSTIMTYGDGELIYDWSEIRARAQRDFEAQPKCDACGEIRTETWTDIYGDGEYCSENCVPWYSDEDEDEDDDWYSASRKTASIPCAGCGGSVENVLPEWGEFQTCDTCSAKAREEMKDYDPEQAWGDFLRDADERGELVSIPDSWLARKRANEIMGYPEDEMMMEDEEIIPIANRLLPSQGRLTDWRNSRQGSYQDVNAAEVSEGMIILTPDGFGEIVEVQGDPETEGFGLLLDTGEWIWYYRGETVPVITDIADWNFAASRKRATLRRKSKVYVCQTCANEYATQNQFKIECPECGSSEIIPKYAGQGPLGRDTVSWGE